MVLSQEHLWHMPKMLTIPVWFLNVSLADIITGVKLRRQAWVFTQSLKWQGNKNGIYSVLSGVTDSFGSWTVTKSEIWKANQKHPGWHISLLGVWLEASPSLREESGLKCADKIKCMLCKSVSPKNSLSKYCFVGFPATRYLSAHLSRRKETNTKAIITEFPTWWKSEGSPQKGEGNKKAQHTQRTGNQNSSEFLSNNTGS